MDIVQQVKNLNSQWNDFFDEFIDDLGNINTHILNDMQNHLGLEIYPKPGDIFKTFSLTSLENIKIIIIGQDCYHKKDQAIGVSFGVNNGIKKPPSLVNIEKEVINDIGKNLDANDLIYWNEQGVLMLNCALTVRQSCPGSHLKIWKPLIIKILKKIILHNPKVCFLLWGNFSINIFKNLNHPNVKHFACKHPSPLSANKGGWFGNKHFSKANQYLIENDLTPIKW